ncbi:hypothetical protein NM688_g6660 [Phlebia brevispora]|uniref:Uncharacterized protein n=1 Tax=Phlebia brevispora TaxID=194682 RepID=A0ACC1SDU4_9APHY|nr:hypothetical protein NM688_g6660 [Phlebia brevispora]
MILDNKKALPDDPTPLDPPPSYEELQRVAASLTEPHENKPFPVQPSSTSPTSPRLLSKSGKRTTSSKSGKSKWFPFGQAARASQEVKTTVLSLRRVRATTSPSPRYCKSSPSKDTPPIYWAIVKRPPEPPNPSDPDLVTVLLSLAAPLSDSTLSEIRLACLQNSDQALFQRLRRLPAFAPLSGPDEILLGASVPPDEIEVHDVSGDEGAFSAQAHILLFQKRMRVTKSVSIEFIARGKGFWHAARLAIATDRGYCARAHVVAPVSGIRGTHGGLSLREGDLACTPRSYGT